MKNTHSIRSLQKQTIESLKQDSRGLSQWESAQSESIEGELFEKRISKVIVHGKKYGNY